MATAKTPAKSAAKGKKVIGPKPGEFPGKIVDIDVSTEMSESFLEYAYSVIYSRALPDARDGLKPVHRRILHQMADMGLRPERGHVKSARVVGEVMLDRPDRFEAQRLGHVGQRQLVQVDLPIADLTAGVLEDCSHSDVHAFHPLRAVPPMVNFRLPEWEGTAKTPSRGTLPGDLELESA